MIVIKLKWKRQREAAAQPVPVVVRKNGLRPRGKSHRPQHAKPGFTPRRATAESTTRCSLEKYTHKKKKTRCERKTRSPDRLRRASKSSKWISGYRDVQADLQPCDQLDNGN